MAKHLPDRSVAPVPGELPGTERAAGAARYTASGAPDHVSFSPLLAESGSLWSFSSFFADLLHSLTGTTSWSAPRPPSSPMTPQLRRQRLRSVFPFRSCWFRSTRGSGTTSVGTGGQVPSARLVRVGQHFDKINRVKCFCEVMHSSSRRWKEREEISAGFLTGLVVVRKGWRRGIQ